MSTTAFILAMVSLEMGALTTTPGGALVLRKLCQADGAVPVGHAAAHAHKDRHLRHADDGLGDGGLGVKG